MSTTEENALKRELLSQIKESGAGWTFVGDWPQKATYYKANGEAMPNLPADPRSMQRYLRRGFTLAPPQKQDLMCGCGAGPFKAKIGLVSHRRTHKEKEA